MKKAVRIHISGSMQGIFFKEFVKSNAEAHDARGYLRFLESGKIEIFIQGESKQIDALVSIYSQGPKYSQVRNVLVKEERLQDFKEFKILSF